MASGPRGIDTATSKGLPPNIQSAYGGIAQMAQQGNWQGLQQLVDGSNKDYSDAASIWLKDNGYTTFNPHNTFAALSKDPSAWNQMSLKGQDPIREAGKQAMGRDLTDKEYQQLKARADTMYNNGQGQSWGQIAEQFVAAPENFSTDIAKSKADAETQRLQDKQISDSNAYVKSNTADPNSTFNQIKGLQEQSLNTQAGNQQDRATQQLINALAARGVSVAGQDPSQISGAFTGGVGKISSDISQNLLAPGQNAINQQFQGGLQEGANQFAQTGTQLSQSQMAQYNQDIATQMANEYAQQMAKDYYANMSNLQNQNQTSPWETALSVAGGIGGALIPGVGISSGMALGGGVGKLIGGNNLRR